MAPEVTSTAYDLWSILSSLAAVVSAVFAAVAAIFSFIQVRQAVAEAEESRAETRRLRAFEYTPGISPGFFEARQKLTHAFHGWSTGEQVTEDQANAAFHDGKLMDAFNLVLNHWGRMASAHNFDLIDKEVAKDLFRLAFVRFWHLYEPYLESQFRYFPALGQQYANSASLYKEWFSTDLLKRQEGETE